MDTVGESLEVSTYSPIIASTGRTRGEVPCLYTPSRSAPSQKRSPGGKAAFLRKDILVEMREKLGVIWEDGDFAQLFPTRGQPVLAPWRLALAAVMQFAENSRIVELPMRFRRGSTGSTLGPRTHRPQLRLLHPERVSRYAGQGRGRATAAGQGALAFRGARVAQGPRSAKDQLSARLSLDPHPRRLESICETMRAA